MNEVEWLASVDPGAMLRGLLEGPMVIPRTPGRRAISDRKLRLFACACMRLTGEKPQWGVDWLTGWEDGEPMEAEPSGQPLLAVQSWVKPGIHSKQVAGLLRDIAGNPFRPCVVAQRDKDARALREYQIIDLDWLTPTVLALAQAAHDELAEDGTLDPVRLAVLADALEEAGCDSEDLLRHLRGVRRHWTEPPLVHVRGCWAVNLILGKE